MKSNNALEYWKGREFLSYPNTLFFCLHYSSFSFLYSSLSLPIFDLSYLPIIFLSLTFHFPFNQTYHFLPLKLLYPDYFIPFNPYFSIYEYRENSFFFFLETFSFHSQSHPLSCAHEVFGRGGEEKDDFLESFSSLFVSFFFWWIIFRRNEMGYDKNFFYL